MKIIEGSDITGPVHETADVCVIGSGAGGPVAAKELAEAGYSVVMVEEGGNYKTEDFTRNLFDMFKMLYRDYGTTLSLGMPGVPFPIGRCIGGTTTVNSGTCFRTPDHILRRWVRRWGIPDIQTKDMTPYFERVEEILQVSAVSERNMGRNGEIILRGARKLGYSCGPLRRNQGNCDGCGVCTLGCPTGQKKATFLNYTPMAMDAGAKVYSDARAEKIIVKNKTVTGIEGAILNRNTSKRKHTFRIDAKIVILAAGAVYTPLLLLKNKLCNSSGQLGKNLRLHPGIRVSALMDEVVNGHLGVPQSVYVDEFTDEGIMLESIFVIPLLTAPSLPYFGEPGKDLMFKYRHIAANGAMIFDDTRGRVRPGIAGRPLITYNIIKEDVKKAQKAIAYTSDIFFAAGAKKVFPAIAWLQEMDSPDNIRQILTSRLKGTDIEFMAFHPMGTARMGVDSSESVIDPYGETFDVKNLFICDASIFPSCLGVNPMESIMAFANRTADYIHQTKM